MSFPNLQFHLKVVWRINTGLKIEIDERKQAEEALKRFHERFLMVLDSIEADVYVADINGNIRNSFHGSAYARNLWR